ncbi:hypothetical protein CO046_02985 [Candidatus Peregrinibacteria bacterium CG_4_9_14_0_2_um_filter_53_11]|nr:MAG: hypothetical protein CO046_02985 [Candidatus Peregrinibacteria bacterium CG_4_9_14_0_2_um_filter_53_11]
MNSRETGPARTERTPEELLAAYVVAELDVPELSMPKEAAAYAGLSSEVLAAQQREHFRVLSIEQDVRSDAFSVAAAAYLELCAEQLNRLSFPNPFTGAEERAAFLKDVRNAGALVQSFLALEQLLSHRAGKPWTGTAEVSGEQEPLNPAELLLKRLDHDLGAGIRTLRTAEVVAEDLDKNPDDAAHSYRAVSRYMEGPHDVTVALLDFNARLLLNHPIQAAFTPNEAIRSTLERCIGPYVRSYGYEVVAASEGEARSAQPGEVLLNCPDGLVIHGDRSAFIYALQSALSNALSLQHNRPNSRDSSLTSDWDDSPLALEVNVTNTNGVLMVEILDSGRGINYSRLLRSVADRAALSSRPLRDLTTMEVVTMLANPPQPESESLPADAADEVRDSGDHHDDSLSVLLLDSGRSMRGSTGLGLHMADEAAGMNDGIVRLSNRTDGTSGAVFSLVIPTNAGSRLERRQAVVRGLVSNQFSRLSKVLTEEARREVHTPHRTDPIRRPTTGPIPRIKAEEMPQSKRHGGGVGSLREAVLAALHV